MQIHQQCRSPVVPQLLERCRQGLVIGSMDIINPTVEFCTLQGAFPDLAEPRELAWYEPETTTCPTIGIRMPRVFRTPSDYHRPVDIIGRAVQVDHGSRRLSAQHGSSSLIRYLKSQRIHMAVFQSHSRHSTSEIGGNGIRVIPPTMWRGDKDRYGGFLGDMKREYAAAALRKRRIVKSGRHIARQHCIMLSRTCREVKQACPVEGHW